MPSSVLFGHCMHMVYLHTCRQNMFWRDSLEIKSTYCSFRGPGFESRHLYGDPQLSVTPGLVDTKLSSGFCGHQA